MAPINDLGEWAVGQTFPAWEFPLKRDTRVFDLTGVNATDLALEVYNSLKAKTGTGKGAFAINKNKPALVTYTQDVNNSDTGTAGTFYFRVKVHFAAGDDFSDYIKIVVNS